MSAPELRYVNHLGREFDFGRPGVFPVSHGLRDWALDRQSMNGRVASYSPRPRELSVEVGFAGDPRAAVDELVSVCRADTEACVPGRLYDGEWYTECFLEESSADLWWLPGPGEHVRTLVFYSEDPSSLRERPFFVPASVVHGVLGYPHGHPHGYGSESSPAFVECLSATECDLRIEVPGPADSPSVDIGGNRYEARVSVPAGGSLVIDTRRLECALETADGLVVDAIDATPDAPPGSGRYAFERIAPGVHSASCDAAAGAFVTVYERGIERLWS